MILVKIMAVMLGLAFLLFGYFIYFQEKYNLINGFEADYQKGCRDERYARRVGLIEFIIGVVLIIISLVLIIFT